MKKLKNKDLWLNILRRVILIIVIALTVYLILIRDKIQALQAYGYPGIFLFSIILIKPSLINIALTYATGIAIAVPNV